MVSANLQIVTNSEVELQERQHSDSNVVLALLSTDLTEMYFLHARRREKSLKPIVPTFELFSHETEQLAVCLYLLNIVLG